VVRSLWLVGTADRLWLGIGRGAVRQGVSGKCLRGRFGVFGLGDQWAVERALGFGSVGGTGEVAEVDVEGWLVVVGDGLLEVNGAAQAECEVLGDFTG